MINVHWTNRAKVRLRLIHQYIAEDSPKVALQVVDHVTTRSQQLAELPHLGRQVPEYQRNDIRELLEKILPYYLQN